MEEEQHLARLQYIKDITKASNQEEKIEAMETYTETLELLTSSDKREEAIIKQVS